MQTDDVVWEIIRKSFCSFKVASQTQTFCRNEWNLTGLCSRQACPLANSQYATVREEKGRFCLFKKEVERSHYPSKQWQKVKLSQNTDEALAQINEELLYWPQFIRSKCRRRLRRIHQVLVRTRRLMLTSKKKIVPIRSKQETREIRRESKALIAARIDNAIEKELVDRLRQGTYGDVYNFPQKVFDKALESEEIQDITNVAESEVEDENSENEEEEEDADTASLNSLEFVEDLEESDRESEIEEITVEAPVRARTKTNSKLLKKPRVEVEYETEDVPSTSQQRRRVGR